MKTFVNAFLEQADLRGSRPAVMDCRGADTYRKMNRMSAVLARMILDTCAGLGTDVEALRREGKSGVRVGLLLPRTRRFFMAELAVLRAGCAAVPMDSAYPEERIRTILEDASCPLCITTKELAGKVSSCPVILLEDVAAAERDRKPDLSLNLSDPDIEGLLIFTSGSTGKPKGVIHRQAIFSHSYEMLSSFHTFTPKDVTCCRASFTFIAAIIDPMPPLMTGGSVYVTNDDERRDAELMHAIVEKRHITGMSIQPVMFQIMREQYGRMPLDWVLMGGEKTKTKYADDGNLLEIYASSEAFTVLTHFMKNGEDPGMLGRPAAGARVYLLDDDGNRIKKPGEIGELCVVSPWIMMGYNNLPEETAKKVTPCPFERGERMYHTGDYMAFDTDGNLIFHGRKDRMVKIRSYRIELGEIENVMNRYPTVKEAACVPVDVHGGKKLCCYYTGEETDPDELRAHAASFLAEYMVPDYFVHLDKLMRNDRGKVQYLALQALEPPVEDDYTAPETPLEERVCAAFASTLSMPRVSVLADFFDLGGTSLTVSVLIRSLGDVRTGLSFQDVVQHPTPRQLAAFLADEDSRSPASLPMDRDAYPLTKTQMGIYLEGLTGGNVATYTVPILVKADPSVSADRLSAAVQAVLSAHPAMKYVIRAGADHVPHIYMVPDAPVEIPVVDGSEEDRLDFMKRFVPVVPMLDGLLFHFAVYRTPERCYLAIKSHLIFLDGTSVNLLIAELNRALTGKAPVPEEFCIQQVGMLEERMMRDGAHDAAREYYRNLFKAMEDIPPLQGDLDGVLVPGESENLRYEPGTLSADRVKAFCDHHQITESSFFMGAMGLMLGKYLNAKHVSFSTVYNGRALAEMKDTIGTLIKRIPVYADLGRDLPVGDYLREMGRQILANMSHDIYSFDEVLKECPVNEDVEFIFQGSQFTDVAAADSSDTLVEGDKWFIEQYHTGMVTGCLSIQFFATAGLYNMTLEYRNKRFSQEWVRRFAENLFIVAEGLLSAETIGEVAMLSEADRSLLAGFNDTAVPMDFVPVHEQIHRRALAAPDQLAVAAAGSELTFRDLDLLSGRIGDALRALGVRADTLVGVLFGREVRAYAAEIGILKAGGAFVPFIPDYPDERIDFCMKDGSIPFLLTTEALRAERPSLGAEGYRVLTVEELAGNAAEPLPAESAPAASKAGDLAYCIYTSGTTGRPKGVMIEHGNIANYVHRNEKSVEIMHYAAPGRVCLALASFSFDVSVVEEFVPLCNGNPVVVATEEEIHTPDLLAQLIRKYGVNGITCTPTYLLSLLDIPAAEEALRGITFFDIGAEAFPLPLCSRLRALRPDSVILNVYGPTEATMGCAAEIMDGSAPVTVGPPIANTEFIVADPFGNPLPPGIRGELMIAGAQVGRGYISLPDKTAESFFTWNGKRAYRSGDLAAWTGSGKIRIFGRVDNQIKLRGFRIELDEIEKVMSEVPGVKVGAVAVRKNNATEYLIGYYTSPSDVPPDAVKRFMQEKLPDYMIPSAILKLDDMPMNANGKVDRKALPRPDFSAFRAAYAAPETPAEKALCRAFAAALKLDEAAVGALDDFFELGGDSLKAMAVLSEAGLDGLNAADVFQKRTPRAIATAVEERAGQGSLEEQEEAARLVEHALSPLQVQMVDTQLFRPGSTMWSNMHFLVRFSPAEVDADRLCAALNRAFANHPALSTAFYYNDHGELVQKFIPGLLPEVVVKNILPETEAMLPDVLVRPFDRLLNSCLVRAGVFRSSDWVYLFMDIHHLLMDGGSLGVLLSDLVSAYEGRDLSKDYYFAVMAEEEKRIAAGSRSRDGAWFRKQYGDDVWCNMPYPGKHSMGINQASREKRLSFTAEDVRRAEDYWGVSHSVMAIAAALLALSKTSGKRHVMVNWIFNNRLAPESENAVGMLIKNLPAAARMEDFSRLRSLLASVKSQVAEGIAHCTYDFMSESYQAYLDDCMEVNLQLGINGSPLKALHPERVPLNDEFSAAGARLELELLENEYGDGGFDSEMEYAEDLFDAHRMETFHDLYISLLEAIVRMEDVLKK